MTIQDKIKKCLPEEWVKPIQTEADKITPKVEKEYKLWLEFIDGFNACKIETCECSIPKILQVIREEVEKKRKDVCLKTVAKYKEKKSCDTSEEVVQNVSVIEDISKEFVPEDKKVNADYYANSLAIVLYFFQMCEIGKRTSNESVPLTLFE